MADIYLAILILLCIVGIGWGVDKTSRIYQFPFVMSGIFVAFIVPQALSLYVTSALPTRQALERVLLMSALCLLMCLLSNNLPVSSKFVQSLEMNFHPSKLFYGGVILSIVGFVASIAALSTPGTANSLGQATGIRTIFSTFTYLSIPGLAILFLLYLRRPSTSALIAVLFAVYVPLQRIILFGRRETTAAFLLTIGLALYFRKRLVVPRIVAICMVIVALLSIPAIGQYRAVSASGNWNQLLNINPVETLQNMIENATNLDLQLGAMHMEATVKTGQYGYGTGYWNELVFRFVPAQFLGKAFKEGLMIRLQDYSLPKLFKYFPNPGSVITGVGDSFMEFDYFGCLVFLLLGWLFKHLWVASVKLNSLVSQIVYISCLPGVLKAVTHGTQTCLADMTFNCIFIFAVLIYARRRTNPVPAQVVRG